MDSNDAVALIVDPDFGERIRDIAARMRHTWVVATSANSAIAEQIWKISPTAYNLNTGGCVTTFMQIGKDRESWCDSILYAVDDHHNAFSCDQGYLTLDVYGTQLTERLQSSLSEFGFSMFSPTEYGFRAQK